MCQSEDVSKFCETDLLLYSWLLHLMFRQSAGHYDPGNVFWIKQYSCGQNHFLQSKSFQIHVSLSHLC